MPEDNSYIASNIAPAEAAAQASAAETAAVAGEAAVTVEPTALSAASFPAEAAAAAREAYTEAAPVIRDIKSEAAPTTTETASLPPAPGSDEWQAKWNAEWNSMMSAASSAPEASASAETAAAATPAETAPRADIAPVPNESGIRPAGKRKTGSFAKRAVAACVAVVLGCGFLGLGLSFGGQIANRLFPDAPASADQAARQAFSFSGQSGSQLPLSYDATGAVNLADVFNSVSQSVVSINLTMTSTNFFMQSYDTPAAGSGIVYDISGDKVYIATNNHVIESANSVSVSLDDTQQVSANFVGSDPNSDLAVISVSKADLDATGIPYKKATFGDSDAMRIGDVVLAVGNAMGEGKTATSGIVSGVNKEIQVDTTSLKVLQTNAAINPGNSGGALANAAGEVIGINTAKLSEADVEGMGYSIPSNEAKDILQGLMENGSVAKPALGVSVITIDQATADLYAFPSTGALVRATVTGGAADKAGIRPNDLIVEYNGVKIESSDALAAEIGKSKVGDTAAVKAYRSGASDYELKDFTVTIQDGNAGNATPNF